MENQRTSKNNKNGRRDKRKTSKGKQGDLHRKVAGEKNDPREEEEVAVTINWRKIKHPF